MCTEGRGQVCREGCRGGAGRDSMWAGAMGLLLLAEILKTREDLSRLP